MEIEWQRLLQWAAEEGLILGADFPGPAERGGREHDVRHDQSALLWWKYTKPDSSGLAVTWAGEEAPYLHNASPSEYFRRILLFNEIFGDDVRLEGLWRDGKNWRIVTSQKDIPGESASIMEICAAMEEEEWEPAPQWNGLGYEESLTFRKGDWLAADIHLGNAVKMKDGTVVVIDFIVTTHAV